MIAGPDAGSCRAAVVDHAVDEDSLGGGGEACQEPEDEREQDRTESRHRILLGRCGSVDGRHEQGALGVLSNVRGRERFPIEMAVLAPS